MVSTEIQHTHDHADQQPSARMCFVCGVVNVAGLQVKFFNDGPGACRAIVTLDTRFQGYPGIAHGGILATLLDETAGRTPMASDPNRFMYSAKLEVRYRQIVPLNTPLTLRGRLQQDRGRIAIAVSELYLPDGKIAAEATVTLMAIPADNLAGANLDEIGWQIYP